MATELTEVRTSHPSSHKPHERYKALVSVFEKCRGGKHLIILHGTPDPDAISSALALDFLGLDYDIETSVLCFYAPSHHENRALVKRLGIELVLYEEAMDLSCFDGYSLVDTQKFHTSIDRRLEDNGVEFFAFIDHHREDPVQPPALFVDVRQQASSTAAICCEYLQQAYPKGLESSDPEHVRLATALMHGLRTDTHQFLLASQLEYEAASYLASCVDQQVLEMVERKVLTSGVLGMLENALTRRKIHDNFIFSDVGFVRSADRDGIPQAADLLLAREGTDTVLVVGIVDEAFIDGSFRTQSQTINPDEFLKGFLGISPESGQYYGGGNLKDRGGFQIPLGFLGTHHDKNHVYRMAMEVVERSLLDYLGKAAKAA